MNFCVFVYLYSDLIGWSAIDVEDKIRQLCSDKCDKSVTKPCGVCLIGKEKVKKSVENFGFQSRPSKQIWQFLWLIAVYAPYIFFSMSIVY